MKATLLHNWTRSRYYVRIFQKNQDKINQLLAVCNDKISVDVIKLILKAYTTVFREPEYWLQMASSEACTIPHFITQKGYEVYGTENPYFLSDIFVIGEDIVLLDGGAYIGDTIELLDKVTNGRFCYIYAFEPNPVIYPELLKRCKNYHNRVKPICAGLDDHDGVMSFICNDSGSKIDEAGKEPVQVVNVEQFLKKLEGPKPNFIKLDVEGRESVVLNAMREYICQEKPDIAVSVYHELEDLWNLPLLLHEICPEYRIYIRHQSNYYTETVCYCTYQKEKFYE